MLSFQEYATVLKNGTAAIAVIFEKSKSRALAGFAHYGGALFEIIRQADGARRKQVTLIQLYHLFRDKAGLSAEKERRHRIISGLKWSKQSLRLFTFEKLFKLVFIQRSYSSQ